MARLILRHIGILIILIMIIIIPVIAQDVTVTPEITPSPTDTATVTATATPTLTPMSELATATSSLSPTPMFAGSTEVTPTVIQATQDSSVDSEITQEAIENVPEATDAIGVSTLEPEITQVPGEAELTEVVVEIGLEAEATEAIIESTVEVEVTEAIIESTAEITETVISNSLELITAQGSVQYQNRDAFEGIGVEVWTLDFNLIGAANPDEMGVFHVQVPIDSPFYIVVSAPLHKQVELLIDNINLIPLIVLEGGDLNADNCINNADMSLLIDNYGQENSSLSDINNDGFTDLSDLAILSGNYNESCVTSIFTNQPTPEMSIAPEETLLPESTEAAVMPESTETPMLTLEPEETVESSDE